MIIKPKFPYLLFLPIPLPPPFTSTYLRYFIFESNMIYDPSELKFSGKLPLISIHTLCKKNDCEIFDAIELLQKTIFSPKT